MPGAWPAASLAIGVRPPRLQGSSAAGAGRARRGTVERGALQLARAVERRGAGGRNYLTADNFTERGRGSTLASGLRRSSSGRGSMLSRELQGAIERAWRLIPLFRQ